MDQNLTGVPWLRLPLSVILGLPPSITLPRDAMLIVLGLLLQVAAPSRDSGLVHRNGRVPRAVTAVRTDTPPAIDGRLDDPIWARITPEKGFRRDVPSDGNPATQETEVRIAYDQTALYVGARLYDDRPRTISRRLNRRDSFSAFNDVFFVLLDSYHDHRTVFVFGVTASGDLDPERSSHE